MIDPRVLEKAGYTTEKLKAKFTGEILEDGPKELVKINQARIAEGYDRNLRNARFYWAIDEAFDTAQSQMTYTIVKGLMSKTLSTDQINSAVQEWGLSSMLCPYVDPKTGKRAVGADGRQLMKLDLPVFYNIYLPIVASYLKARMAKIWSDLDQDPLYKYDPAVFTARDKAKCELITSRISIMSTQMGYRDDERQSLLQTLLYGWCLALPQECWYRDVRYRVGRDEKIQPYVHREGIRWAMPHPSRCFYDLAHRLSSVNTDTGVRYAGMWDVYRYGEVAANPHYWIKDKTINIKPGSVSWLESGIWSLYQTMYPCVMTLPDWCFSAARASKVDRTEESYRYVMSDYDRGICLCNLYSKLNPKQFGLFDYDGDVWFRFVHAMADVVLYAEPIAYHPVVAYQYDPDQNRYRNASLAYELIPFQDHLGNLLTQYLLTIKRNLANVVFFNTDAITEETIEKVQNLGKKMYVDLNFVPMSKRALRMQQSDMSDLFAPMDFPQANSQEHAFAIVQVLNVMERALGYSAQEVGAPASHQQSATEIRVTQSNIGIRVDYTKRAYMQGIIGKKETLYEGLMAYGDDTVMAAVGVMNDETRATLTMLGFHIEGEDNVNKTAGVLGPKSALSSAMFASDREGDRRISDQTVAVGVFNIMDRLLSNPTLAEMIGPDAIARFLNSALQYSGLPKGLKIEVPEPAMPDEQKMAAMQQQMVQIAQQVSGQQLEELAQALAKNALEPIAAAVREVKMQQEAGQAAIIQLAQVGAQRDQELAQQTKQADMFLAQAQAQHAKEMGAAHAQTAQVVQQTAAKQELDEEVMKEMLARQGGMGGA